MFALVVEKSKKNQNSIEILIDNSKAQFVEEEEKELSYSIMHCYYVDSLATNLREYRTLRMSEFYLFSPIILNPQLANKGKFIEDSVSP